ncbi:hypothetical protein CPZ32_12155 [Bacillus cereus]|nr:hypothetical protein CPZ32_12155 [Bacillus cereus]
MEMLLKLMKEMQKQNSEKFSEKKSMKKTKKCAAKKVWKIPPTLLEKNKKYHVITGKVSLTPKVPIGPNSVEIKKIILYE